MDIKCELIAYERYSKTTIIFFKEFYTEDKFDMKFNEFKQNKKIHKIVKIENDVEEILLERV